MLLFQFYLHIQHGKQNSSQTARVPISARLHASNSTQNRKHRRGLPRMDMDLGHHHRHRLATGDDRHTGAIAYA